MTRWDKLKPQTLEHYVIEWCVEDVKRYERLSKNALKVEKRDGRAADGRPTTDEATNSIITAVLSVPRPMTEHVTTMLRSAPDLRPALYLPAASACADDAAAANDAIVKMRLVVSRLEELCFSFARQLDRVQGTGTHEAELRAELDRTKLGITKRVDKVVDDFKKALEEKQINVAAKLLAAMPDDLDKV